MKLKIIILLVLLTQILTAQKGARIGYIDMDLILENIDERNPFLRDLEHNGHGFRERWRPGLFPGAKARVPGGPLQIPARAQVGSGLH